jgi:hypothetical protein
MALAYHHVDPDSSGGGNGSSWATSGGNAAFTIAEWIADFAACAAGDIYFLKPAVGGTITLTADIVTDVVGTLNLPIGVVGVKIGTTNVGAAIDDSDFPTGTDRPFIDGGLAYMLDTEDFIWIRNIRMESGDTYVIKADANSIVDNCKAYNDSSTGSRVAIGGSSATHSMIISCDAQALNGNATSVYTGSKVLFSYLHDSSGYGIACGSSDHAALFCIFDNLSQGIGGASRESNIVFGCTFYDCDYGIYDSAAGQSYNNHLIVNNIFSECDTADILMTSASMDCYIAYNNHHNSADKYSGVPEEGDADDLFCDWWKTVVDPAFTTPGSNFSLGAGSACINTGMAITVGVG